MIGEIVQSKGGARVIESFNYNGQVSFKAAKASPVVREHGRP